MLYKGIEIMLVKFSMFIAWCAKLYRNGVYDTLIKEVEPSEYVKLAGVDQNEVSSLRVDNGCKLNAFTNNTQNDLLFSTTTDIDRLGPKGYNDQMTGYSCICNGMNP